jgi:carbon-monoxide dehydrogenase large subunit
LLWTARTIERPVKWRGDRSETFVSDYHGRDQTSHAEMGLDEDGRVVALKIDTILNLGAYVTETGPRVPIQSGRRIIPCAYDIENFHYSVKLVFSNMVPTDTYRGAGAPEANLLLERLVDEAAGACDLSRPEIPRRNLIPQAKLPYRTQMGVTIDSGDFVGIMEKALAVANWDGFPKRRRNSEVNGKLRGIGCQQRRLSLRGTLKKLRTVAKEIRQGWRSPDVRSFSVPRLWPLRCVAVPGPRFEIA